VDVRALREVLEIVAHKYDLAILTQLRERPLRYMQLLRKIRETDSDLSEGVQTKNLKRLTANGLIHQESLGNRHYGYALTPHGRYLVAILAQITALHDKTTDPDEDQPGTSSETPPAAEHETDTEPGHDEPEPGSDLSDNDG
jgi:DNA-binding HxlR family transcriptional regulator